MHRRLFNILFLIFLSYCVHAQPVGNFFQFYNKVASFDLVDVKQQKSIKLTPGDKRLSLFIFLSPECPLCQNYTKTLNGLHKKFSRQLNLYGIIPGRAYTIKEVTAFINKYQTEFGILIDTKQKLTHYLNARVTPQAILLDNEGTLIYKGAIDDWVQGLGKKKLQVSQHYLQRAIEQTLKPEFVKVKTTEAFGCKINDY